MPVVRPSNYMFFLGTSILLLMPNLIAATAIEKSSVRFHFFLGHVIFANREIGKRFF